MLKHVIFLGNLLVMLILEFLFYGRVTIGLKTPEVVVAGEEFEVEITVNKSYLSSFARFVQDLPAGLTATPSNSANADFSFNDKRVRLIWLRLPAEETFTFSYKIKVDERLKGDFIMGGSFSFIENNERMTIDVEPKTIIIEPSPLIDESLIVDIDDFESLVIQDLTPKRTDKVVCIRDIPEVNTMNNEIIINLLVNKENKEKFAKIEEKVPVGYTALSIDTKEGIFTFKDNMAKFLWMNLPSDKYFTVSYKLIPEGGATVRQVDIDGRFSYIEGDRTEILKIIQKEINLEELTPYAVDELLGTLPEINDLRAEKLEIEKTQPEKDTTTTTTPIINLPPVDKDTTKDKEPDKIPDKEPVDTTPEDIIPDKDPVITTPISDNNNKDKNQQNNNLTQNYVSDNTHVSLGIEPEDLPYLLEPEQGVYYRVQVAAGHKPVDIKWYFKRLKIEDEVRTEIHENWIKYSIGSFDIYKKARDYRVHIWNTTEVDDAFVAAYHDGKRITVQEALMIANQEWYE